MVVKPTVYIETSVVSYLTAHPSRDLIVAAHQQITQEWWDSARMGFDLFVSPVVMDEIAKGDAGQAQKRLASVEDMPVLAVGADVHLLTAEYMDQIVIPGESKADAFHLALASWHGMDYLLTWNCRHIANAAIKRIVESVNGKHNIRTPIICTPEELMEA